MENNNVALEPRNVAQQGANHRQINPQQINPQQIAPQLKSFKLLKGSIDAISDFGLITFFLMIDFYSDKGLSLATICDNYNIKLDHDLYIKLTDLGY